MGLINSLARVLLSGIFISGGIDVLRAPGPRAVVARPFLERVRALVPALPSDPVLAVRANAAIQLAAGATLAVGILPRLSAFALAGSLVPTTLGRHRFWEQQGPAAAQQRTQFLKNAAILGGLILVANVPRCVCRASEIGYAYQVKVRIVSPLARLSAGQPERTQPGEGRRSRPGADDRSSGRPSAPGAPPGRAARLGCRGHDM